MKEILLKIVKSWNIREKPEYRSFRCALCQKYIKKAFYYWLNSKEYFTPVHFCKFCQKLIKKEAIKIKKKNFLRKKEYFLNENFFSFNLEKILKKLNGKKQSFYQNFSCDFCQKKLFKAYHCWIVKKNKLIELHFCKKCYLKMKKKIIVLWDFDGTLVETMKDHVKLATQVISKHFKLSKKKAKEKYLETSGLPFAKQLEIIFPQENFKKLRQKCAKEYQKRKIKEVYGKIKSRRYSKEILEETKKETIKQFILSGTEEKIVKNWLKKEKIKGIEVLGKEKGTKKDHFQFLFRKFNRANHFFILVSDSPKDMELPADLKVVILTPLFKRKDFEKKGENKVIKNLKEVLKILNLC